MSQISGNATTTARAMDDERLSGKIRGPLHGIPVLLKGIISTIDDLESTLGSTALLGA